VKKCRFVVANPSTKTVQLRPANAIILLANARSILEIKIINKISVLTSSVYMETLFIIFILSKNQC
jgi:hypothetical protein